MAFFDTLKQNLMTASQVTMDKSKNTAEILKLKDQIRQDKREIRSATCDILPNLQDATEKVVSLVSQGVKYMPKCSLIIKYF